MFLMGLNPTYTPLVYSQNPADLDAVINSARTIEIGYNFATGRIPKSINNPVSVTPKPVNNEVDELTKRMEQLSLNYANLTTALLAQTQTLPRIRNFNNERNFPNERNFNNERNFPNNRNFQMHREDLKQPIYRALIVEKSDILVENALHLSNQSQTIVICNSKNTEMFI